MSNNQPQHANVPLAAACSVTSYFFILGCDMKILLEYFFKTIFFKISLIVANQENANMVL
jgi:hypothetical protein